MSDNEDASTVLMTAPVKPETAEKFKEIAKGRGVPLRVLGGMLYENFIEEHESGKVFVMPAQLGKQESKSIAPAKSSKKRKPTRK